MINYQGRVTVSGTNFTGTGQFRFALVNCTGATTYWSNGVNNVALTVTKGLYSVLLGNTNLANMAALPASSAVQAEVNTGYLCNKIAGIGNNQWMPLSHTGSIFGY